MRPCGAAEQNSVDGEDRHPYLTLFPLKVSGDLEIYSPGHVPIGAGGGRGPSNPQPIGVGSVSVLPSIWDWVRSLSFSLQDHLLCSHQAHDELPESTHPDLLKIRRHTTKGDITEANMKERERGGGSISVSDSNIRHDNYNT